jgi:hypothetical protein
MITVERQPEIEAAALIPGPNIYASLKRTSME